MPNYEYLFLKIIENQTVLIYKVIPRNNNKAGILHQAFEHQVLSGFVQYPNIILLMVKRRYNGSETEI